MKAATLLSLFILSFSAFGAELNDCVINGKFVDNVVLLNEAGNNSIQKILDSKKSDEEKTDLIKRILYIETLSIGDGNSVCDLAVKSYKVSEEKCMKVMKSKALLEEILSDSSDIDATLGCKIGVSAKLQMQFNM